MRKIRSIQAATFVALSLSLAWTAKPAHSESGKLYRYTSSSPDGTIAGDELLFVSGSRVEVLSKGRSDGDGILLMFEMDGPGLAPRALKIWEVSAVERTFMGTIESLPSGKEIRVEVIPSGRPAETVAAPVFPWLMFNGVPALNLAFAAQKDPKESFSVGLIRPNDEPNEPSVRFSGPIKLSYAGDEERAGVPTRKYRLEGEGVSGFAWVHRDEKRLEAWETERAKLQLAGVQTLDAAGWEEAKRALLGPPPPKGPVEAVAVKPHPCRVPNYDKEVLCATYPVWENRETKQGRKIGLNIVILPALGPDKEKDPVFELAGGPGQAVTQDAGWLAQSSKLREKRDIVLVDQRGTGRSNPLHCSFYGEPVDVRIAAGDLLPADRVRKCREELEKVADLAQYTTAAFADDLDEVRQWLGYERINLKGGSYGTDAAQVYWRRHPKTVRSVVLIGVANPKWYNPLGHAAAGQRALDLLVAECAGQPECKAAFPDTRAELKAVKERIEKGVTVTVLNTRTGERQEVRPSWGLVAEGIRFLMYGPVAGSLPLQVRKAAEGDLAPLVQMSIGRRLGIMEGLDWGLTLSVTCAEDLPFITEEMVRQRTAGTYLGDYRVRQQKAACEIWPRGKATEDDHELVHSDLPVLLISGATR
jgi:pimeloyl-ACP methyl ester carboxylesterase